MDGTTLLVEFDEKDEPSIPGSAFGRSIELHSGGNFLASNAAASGAQLFVGGIGGTEMGCREDLARQDDWVSAFFAADPRWQLEGTELTLRAKRTIIRLAERQPG